jgi:aconitate hydratase
MLATILLLQWKCCDLHIFRYLAVSRTIRRNTMTLTTYRTARAIHSRRVLCQRLPFTCGLATLAPRVPISPLNPDSPLDYDRRISQLEAVKFGSRRPLTLTEKVLYSHLYASPDHAWRLEDIRRGETLLHLRPDRVACHDATATMALLQFISAGLPNVQVPTTIHSDHLVVSRDGADKDLKRGRIEHQEVYAFLSSAAKKYGIGWWKPGGERYGYQRAASTLTESQPELSTPPFSRTTPSPVDSS